MGVSEGHMRLATRYDELNTKYRKLRQELAEAKAAMGKACRMVEACGHSLTCSCCWCRMRHELSRLADQGGGCGDTYADMHSDPLTDEYGQGGTGE